MGFRRFPVGDLHGRAPSAPARRSRPSRPGANSGVAPWSHSANRAGQSPRGGAVRHRRRPTSHHRVVLGARPAADGHPAAGDPGVRLDARGFAGVTHHAEGEHVRHAVDPEQHPGDDGLGKAVRVPGRVRRGKADGAGDEDRAPFQGRDRGRARARPVRRAGRPRRGAIRRNETVRTRARATPRPTHTGRNHACTKPSWRRKLRSLRQARAGDMRGEPPTAGDGRWREYRGCPPGGPGRAGGRGHAHAEARALPDGLMARWLMADRLILEISAPNNTSERSREPTHSCNSGPASSCRLSSASSSSADWARPPPGPRRASG